MKMVLDIMIMLIIMYMLIGAMVVTIHYEKNRNGMKHKLFDNPMSATYYIVIWPLVLLDAEM